MKKKAPKPVFGPCRKCGEDRNAKTGECRNGCDNWTAAYVGTAKIGGYKTRGGPRGQIAEQEH